MEIFVKRVGVVINNLILYYTCNIQCTSTKVNKSRTVVVPTEWSDYGQTEFRLQELICH